MPRRVSARLERGCIPPLPATPPPLARVLILAIVLAFAAEVRAVDPVDRYLTVELRALVAGPADNPDYWMFDNDTLWWTQKPQGTSLYAPSAIRWAPDATGDTSCISKGAGMASSASCTAALSNLGGLTSSSLSSLAPRLDGLLLDSFRHINTLDRNEDWNITGAAGDERKYTGGTLEIRKNDNAGQILLRVADLQFVNQVNYVGPIGNSPTNQFGYGGYFVGTIDMAASDPAWIGEFDPTASGTFYASLDGVATSANAFACYTPLTYQISIRAGDFVGAGAQIEDSAVQDPQALADRRARQATTLGAVAASSVGATAVAVAAVAISSAVLSALFIGTPLVFFLSVGGAGTAKMIRTAAWTAAFAQINGGADFSQAVRNFGYAMNPFILRMNSPWSSDADTAQASTRSFRLGHLATRQEAQGDDDSLISASEFRGVAFWAFVALGSCLALHAILAISIWRASRNAKIKAHSWMTYLTSIAIAYVFSGTVLGSIQYMRSAKADGSGEVGLYVLAVLLIIVYGLCILGFICSVIFLARNQLREGQLDWVPKDLSSDPELRKSKIAQGEYETEEDNIVHGVFACYYDGLRGPRVWVAWLDQTVIVFEILIISLVASHTAALVLLLFGSILFLATVVILNPFVDKIESLFQAAIALFQTMVAGVAVAGIFSTESTREMLHMAIVVLEFIALGVAIVMAVYVDVLTILTGLWDFIKAKFVSSGAQNGDQAQSNARLSDISGLDDDENAPPSRSSGYALGGPSSAYP